MDAKKTYTVFPYFRSGDNALVTFFGALIIGAWLVPFLIYLDSGLPLRITARLSLSLSMMFVLLAWLARLCIKEIRQTAFSLSDETLMMHSFAREAEIDLSQVKKFEYRHMPILHGFGLLRLDGGTVRMPFIIDNLPRLIADLRTALVCCGNMTCFDNDNIEFFIREALANDASTRRLAHAFAPVMCVGEIMLLFGFIVARWFWYLPLAWSLAWGILSMIMPFAGLLLADAIISLKFRNSLRKKGGAAVDEKRIFVITGAIMLVCYLAAGIAVRILLWTHR
jgi:hypothetical protein